MAVENWHFESLESDVQLVIRQLIGLLVTLIGAGVATTLVVVAAPAYAGLPAGSVAIAMPPVIFFGLSVVGISLAAYSSARRDLIGAACVYGVAFFSAFLAAMPLWVSVSLGIGRRSPSATYPEFPYVFLSLVAGVIVAGLITVLVVRERQRDRLAAGASESLRQNAKLR